MCPAARQRRSRNAFSIAAASSSAFLSAIILKIEQIFESNRFFLFRLLLYHILLSISQNVLPIRLINVFLRYKPFQFRRIRPERKKRKEKKRREMRIKKNRFYLFLSHFVIIFCQPGFQSEIENERFHSFFKIEEKKRSFTRFLDAIFLSEDRIRLFCSFVDVLEVFVENWRYHFVICD